MGKQGSFFIPQIIVNKIRLKNVHRVATQFVFPKSPAKCSRMKVCEIKLSKLSLLIVRLKI